MVFNLGEEPVSLFEFARILDSGLENLRPGRVPPRLDQVLVGAVDRSRQPDIRACFILGANDGVFPARSGEDVVFDDREREELRESFAMELSPSGRERAYTEDYYAYIALTRASERLWVSWARSDDGGRALAPSPLVTRIKLAFPAFRVPRRVKKAALQPAPGEVSSEAEALAEVTRILGKVRRGEEVNEASSEDEAADRDDPDDPLSAWLEAYNWLVSDRSRRQRARTALTALVHFNQAVSLCPKLARDLPGKTSAGEARPSISISSSVSRLEDYARCPFRYLARAGLRLEPRPEQRVGAPEIGSYCHAVLSVFARNLAADGLDLARLSRDEVRARLDEAVEEVRPRLQGDVLASTAYYRYLAQRLRQTVGRTIEVLTQHARRSAFRPVGVELRFNLQSGSGPKAVNLTGFIDRLEAAEFGDRHYVRVVDFKSTPRGVHAGRLCEGFDLQLPAYLLAATDPKVEWSGKEVPTVSTERAVPAGALLFPVGDPFVSAAGPLPDRELEYERMSLARMQGLVLAGEDVLELMDRERASDEPPLLPVTYTSRGKLRSSKSAVTRSQMEILLAFAWEKMKEQIGKIKSGVYPIAPARMASREPACSHCEYRPVCRFDPSAGDRPRRIRPPNPDEAWELMEERVKEGRPDHGP